MMFFIVFEHRCRVEGLSLSAVITKKCIYTAVSVLFKGRWHEKNLSHNKTDHCLVFNLLQCSGFSFKQNKMALQGISLLVFFDITFILFFIYSANQMCICLLKTI